MNFALGWALFGVVFLVVVFFIHSLIRYYSDNRESSPLAKFAVGASLFVQLLCLCILPLDVFVVSSNIDATTGIQLDADQTTHDGRGIQIIYYILYFSIAACGSILLPFSFFFYEEEDDDTTTCERVGAASKYTALFVIVLGVLLVIGALLKNNGDSSRAWIGQLASSADGNSYI